MARYISFAILFAILIVIGVLFYRVMIGFFVPVFIAVVLVVVFRPLHRWVLSKVGGRDHIAASVTTFMIVLMVLLPTALVIGLAAVQGAKLIENFNESSIRVGLGKLRANEYINLESPCSDVLQSIQVKVLDIQKEVAEASSYAQVTNPQGRLAGDVLEIKNQLSGIPKKLIRFSEDKVEQRILANTRESKSSGSPQDLDKILREVFAQTAADVQALAARVPEALDDPEAMDLLLADKESLKQQRQVLDRLSEVENRWVHDAQLEFVELATASHIAATKMIRSLDELSHSEDGNLARLQESVWQLVGKWQDVRETILGGKMLGFLKDLANPTTEQVRELLENAVTFLRPKLISFGGDSAAFLIRLVVGLTILMLSLYFFLCDGPSMIRTLMDLSPLDDRYEMELLAEFDRTSRAIVLATILSAIAQGAVAGVGYYFAGMPSLVLLTALTTVCALIPFFGTGLVWVPVSLYLAIYEERFLAAGLLATWGMLVVGTIDNLIKVLILHGQRQLHPLLALLSILGGIQSLGPIGIVVGPLAVTLLQTTLMIMRNELTEIKDDEGSPEVIAAKSAVRKPLSDMIRKIKKPESQEVIAEPAPPTASTDTSENPSG